MNESDQRDLEQLKQRQQLIAQQLAALADDIRRLEVRTALAAQSSPLEPPPVPAPPPLKFQPPPSPSRR